MIMTELQIRAQFSMWAVVSAPMLISGSITKMTTETLATYSNKAVIAVSQDPLGHGGDRVAGGDMAGCHGKSANCTNVWSKALSTGGKAVIFLNTGSAPAKVCVTMAAAGITGAADTLRATDLWTDAVVTEDAVSGKELCSTDALPAEGGMQMLTVQ